MPLVFLFAFIGLVIGGLPGLLIGAIIGYASGHVMRNAFFGGVEQVQRMQSLFLDATFSVMGALCKADGVVTRDEINVTEQIFARLRLSAEQREAAKAAFNRGKAPGFDLDGEVDKLAAAARGRGMLFQLFLQVQVSAVAADGEIHPAEHAMLVRVARRLGLTERDVAQLEALLRAASGGARAPGAPPPKARLDDAYAALGLKADASAAEIKRAYRKLISQNHPDKLAAKGMPESMREIAEERSREINTAYDLIKESRGFV